MTMRCSSLYWLAVPVSSPFRASFGDFLRGTISLGAGASIASAK